MLFQKPLVILFIIVGLISCSKEEVDKDQLPDGGDKSQGWVKISSDRVYYQIAVSGQNIFASTLSNGVYRKTDNGDTWISINNGLTTSYINVLTVVGSNLFAGTDKGVFRISNNGTNWEVGNGGLPDKCEVDDIAVLGSYVFIATNKGVYRSADQGKNWQSVNNTALLLYPPDPIFVYPIGKLGVSGSTIFAASVLNGILRSTDYGESWEKVDNVGYLTSVAVAGNNILWAKGIYGFFSSDNYGSNWSLANTTGINASIISCLAASGANVFATGGGDIYRSTNSCKSWSLFEEGLEDKYFQTGFMALTISGNTIYAIIDGDVWKRTF